MRGGNCYGILDCLEEQGQRCDGIQGWVEELEQGCGEKLGRLDGLDRGYDGRLVIGLEQRNDVRLGGFVVEDVEYGAGLVLVLSG